MVKNLKNIIFLIEQVNAQYKNKLEKKSFIQERLEQIDYLPEILKDIDLRIKSTNINNICEVAKSLIFLRAKLKDYEFEIANIADMVEKIFMQLDTDHCD